MRKSYNKEYLLRLLYKVETCLSIVAAQKSKDKLVSGESGRKGFTDNVRVGVALEIVILKVEVPKVGGTGNHRFVCQDLGRVSFKNVYMKAYAPQTVTDRFNVCDVIVAVKIGDVCIVSPGYGLGLDFYHWIYE